MYLDSRKSADATVSRNCRVREQFVQLAADATACVVGNNTDVRLSHLVPYRSASACYGPAEGRDSIMKWDDLTLVILAVFGCFTLLLTQISEVLSKLPQIIRAWRQVRRELSSGIESNPPSALGSSSRPGAPAVDSCGGENHNPEGPEARREEH